MVNELKDLIIQNSLVRSNNSTFKLVSGTFSNTYFNLKKTLLTAKGQFLVGNIIYTLLSCKYFKYNIHGIGGLTLGADPIALAVSYTSYLHKNPIEPFIVRDSLKNHGVINKIESILIPPVNVAVVDDVVTAGTSIIKAIQSCKEYGFNVVLAIALVDREELDGSKNILKHVDKMESIFKISDFT